MTDRTGSAKRRTILLIEDDESTREVISLALAGEGYRVVTAPDGAAALDLVPRVHPRLILLDLRLPIIDGREFLEAYRQMPGPYAPVILMTTADDVAEMAQEIGTDGYLAKPFDLGDLLKLVSQQTLDTSMNGEDSR
jgi:two-component system, OmpR family, response regulator MtrA